MSGQSFVIFFSGAGAAEGAAIFHNFALEIDAFAALRADNARTLETRQIFRQHFNFYPLLVEKNLIGQLRVGFLLAGVFAIQLTILTYGLGQDFLLSLLKDSLCPYGRLGKERGIA